MTFAPRSAIVTASDSGIGKATAVALAEAGMDVGITWHTDEQGAEKTAAEVREHGRRAEVVRLDTADLAGCGDVIDGLVDRLGGVDVFVNNAGTGSSTLAVDMPLEEWRHVVATDLDGAFVCLQRAARHMIRAGRGGRLIAVTSVHEHQPRVGSAAYDAAKHGLGGLMKTLALELGRHRITANCVAPGEIATPMTGQEDEDPHGKSRPGVPLGRPGDAREIAAVICVSGLAAGVLRHRRELAGGRRHVADGPAGGLAHPVRRLAFRLRVTAPRPAPCRGGRCALRSARCL
ncbi:MAG TPA: SDR family oxidoreductase [Jatrophihabitans sp.]|nr:SDR family oxidoreductase [Jatrophihabitans sp.]